MPGYLLETIGKLCGTYVRMSYDGNRIVIKPIDRRDGRCEEVELLLSIKMEVPFTKEVTQRGTFFTITTPKEHEETEEGEEYLESWLEKIWGDMAMYFDPLER